MTTGPDLETRLRRLANDDLELYRQIDAFKNETSQRFTGIDQRLDRIDQRLDRIEATLTEVLRRLPEPG